MECDCFFWETLCDQATGETFRVAETIDGTGQPVRTIYNVATMELWAGAYSDLVACESTTPPDPDPDPDPTYTIIEQPTPATGEVGSAIDLGGAINSGGMNWETSTSPSGPWTTTSEPTTITTEGTVYYRFCSDDGTTCSVVVAVEGVTSGIFDPTTATGEIGTQGNNITDAAGNRISGGGGNAAINQRTSP